MKNKRAIFVALLIFTLLLSSCGGQPKPAQSVASSGGSSAAVSNLDDKAKSFVQLLMNDKASDAQKMFDATMTPLMSADKLKATWDQVAKTAGAYSGVIKTTDAAVQGYKVVYVTTSHEKCNIVTKVVFGSDEKIAGLFFSYNTDNITASKTSVSGGVKETQFMMTSGQYKLPAALTEPASAGKFPAVVLISGSGAHDMDESYEQLKPFKDIADGLAKKGIAVLRFDKRTFSYGSQAAANATIDWEYTEDAANAVKYLNGRSDISRVYMLGHSEGGMLLPRLALASPKTAGLIILAGSPRRFEDIMVDQVALLEPSQLAAAKEMAQKAKALDKLITAPNEILFGMPASYIKDLDSHDAAKDAVKLHEPMLILQGEHDAQVYMADFNAWKTKLSSLDNITCKSYPSLNHFFMAGKGKPNVEEYKIPGHVDQTVINDITDFISKNK